MKKVINIRLFLHKKILLICFLLIIVVISIFLFPAMLKNVEALSGEPTENLIEDDSAGKDIYEANGWIPETQQVKMSVPIFEAEDDFSSLAQIIDYTDEFPIPGNQGSQGSCTAWAVGYAAKSYLVNVGQKWGVNNHQFSPAYIYNQLNGGEDKGISIYDAMNLVVEQGVCLLTDMPYNQNDYTTQPTQNQRSLASAYRSLSIRRTGAGDINDMKVSLNLGIPIVIGIKVYPDFDKINNANPIYDIISGEARGNHAICLIGYDDTKNAFKFINSWGTSWGLNGYGYISYSLIEEFDTTGWILYDAKCGLFANSEFNGTELTQYVPINDTVKSLSIFEGITKIGKAAFIGQSGIIKIRLPSTIANIGDNAFENCTSLTEIHIPAAVTDIGAEAFKGCSGLTELTFEADSNLYSIGVSAFYGCTSLEEVTIPASVVFIRRSAFEYCIGMETLTFEEGSNLRYAFGLEENAFAYCQSLSEINYNVRALVGVTSNASVFAMARDSADIQLNIGAEVEWIPDYLFSGARISSISFAQPSNVTEIGDYAFTNYTGNQITIPQSVNWVFENSFPAGTTVTWEGKYVYNGSTLLQYLGSDTAFTVPQTIAEKAITAIGANAFAGKTSLRECIIPAAIEEIGANAFSGCTDLVILAEAAAKPAGWSDAFNPENVPVVWDWDSLNYTPINGGSEYAVTKGSGSAPIVFIPSYHNEKPVTAIGEQGFAGMENLTAVVFQDGSNITDIGREAFDGCALLSDIVLPGGVTYIGADAFSGCHSLAYIEIPQGAANIKLNGFSPETTVEWQGRFLFRGDTLLQYSGDEAVFAVPEGIAVIGANAFADNTALEKCIVPVTVTDMEQDALKGCTGTIVAEAAVKPVGWDEEYNPDNVTIVWNLPEAAAGLTYTEINGGTEYAVSKGAQNAEMVYIPAYYNGKPVTQIGNLGFAYMTSIIAVEFEENSNISAIGQQAFHGCENLASIVLLDSILSIGDSAFIECKSLTNMVLPGGLTEIGVNIFLDCIALKSAVIPDGVTEIGAHAFHGCSSLERIDLPDTVKQIGDYAFLGCHSLERINISEDSELETIGVSAFLDCISLTKVVLPSGAASIGRQAFHGCTNLTSIYIPESVETIGWYAFVGCGKVTVYTPHAALPTGWDVAFNPSGGSVEWNYPTWYLSDDEGVENNAMFAA